MKIDERRIQIKKENSEDKEIQYVVYWMNREMRIHDNWAFLYAIEKAKEYNTPISIVYNLDPHFLGGGGRQLWFKRERLIELCNECDDVGVEFIIIEESKTITKTIEYAIQKGSVCLVTDMSPLRIQQNWLKEISQNMVEVVVVDAHNIVPIWVASEKQEFAARTIRPKIQRLLSEFLTPFPDIVPISKHKYNKKLKENLVKQRDTLLETLDISLFPKPRKNAAEKRLQDFLQETGYETTRNNALSGGVSGLSPYFHFGIISPQKVAYEVMQSNMKTDDKNAFLEEMIMRRELSDNFCYYHKNYDSFEGLAPWAQKTLNEHRTDTREYVYTKTQFEHAQTHDDLWNSCQQEMLQTGKMHGHMRMYWAKKILQWTKTPEEAIKIAIYLNDTYEFDGRDPNGYVGILWSIGGLHDRPWFTRPIFGLVRYMARSGIEKKTDVKAYIQQWLRNKKHPDTLY